MSTDARAALDRRRENGDVAKDTSMTSLIREMQPQFQMAMPRGAEAQQLVRDALTALRTIKHLDRCDPASVLGSLMTCAQLGLRVGVLGQAWPIPFKKWDPVAKVERWNAQLIIGYTGYTELAHRSPKVRSFIPRAVHENDEFDVDYGIAGTLVHKPAQGPRGEVTGFHSIAKYDNGGYDFLYMSREEMEAHRDKFAMTRGKDGKVFGVWKDHFVAMGMKTTQRLLAKYIPKSGDLAVATFVDGGLRIDLNPKVPAEEVTRQIEEDEILQGEVMDSSPAGDPDLPIDDRQRKAIMAIANDLQMGRDQRISWLGELTGRPITSSNELTQAEAETAIAAMRRFKDQQGG